jgi:hypothetical protein
MYFVQTFTNVSMGNGIYDAFPIWEGLNATIYLQTLSTLL